MEPMLPEETKKRFYKYLDQLTGEYFEFGSGGSTYQACLRQQIQKIYSIESDPDWVKKLKKQPIIKENQAQGKLEITYVDMDAIPDHWGRPGPKSNLADWQKYYQAFQNLAHPEKVKLMLIDGRFRVACALHSFEKLSPETIILFDDFWDRPRYQIVLDFFEPVHKSKDRAVFLRKKTQVAPPSKDLLKKYGKISL